MIGNINIRVSAGHVNLPLPPVAVFKDSAASVSIEGAPLTKDGITISGVNLAVTNAAGTTTTVAAASVGKVWTATLPETVFASAGSCKNGVVVYATGTDENGTARTWCLGRGDVYILATDSAAVNLGSYTNVRLIDEEPTTAHKGDLCLIDSTWKLYDGTSWIAFGGGGGTLTHKLTAGSKEFDGSADVELTYSDVGALSATGKAVSASAADTATSSVGLSNGAATLTFVAGSGSGEYDLYKTDDAGGSVKVATATDLQYAMNPSATSARSVATNNVYYISTSGTGLSICPPPQTSGLARDFVLYIFPSAAVTLTYEDEYTDTEGTVHAVTWFSPDADGAVSLTANALSVLYVSEIPTSDGLTWKFAVSKQELTEVTNA